MSSILYKKVRKAQKELAKEAKKEVSKNNKTKAKEKKLLEKILNSCKGYDNKGKIVPYTKKEKEDNTYVFVHGHKFIIPIDTFEDKNVLFCGNTCNIFDINTSGKIVWTRNDVRSFRLLQSLKKVKSITVIANFITCVYWENLFKHNGIINYKIYTVNDINEKAEKSCYQYLYGYEFKDGKKVGRLKNIFNKMPHFDVTIMNPPYNKNTHLKILDTIRNYSSKIINISPVRWLTDPFASLKKSTLRSYETLAKHINSINIIESRDASSLFGIQIYSDVAIYEISEDKNPNFDYFNFWKITKTPVQVSIIDKIINNKKTKLKDVIEHSMNYGIRVPVTDIAGNRGCLPTYKDICYCVDGYVDGKLWHTCKNNGGYEKEGEMIPNSIKFKNTQDAVNFYNSYQTLLELKGICRLTVQQQHIQTFILPFLDDYSHPITKEDIKKYYNFTDDEINELGRIGQLKNNEKI